MAGRAGRIAWKRLAAAILLAVLNAAQANNAILPLARNGIGTIRARPFVAGGGQVHLILDVNGYFE